MKWLYWIVVLAAVAMAIDDGDRETSAPVTSKKLKKSSYSSGGSDRATSAPAKLRKAGKEQEEGEGGKDEDDIHQPKLRAGRST